MPKKRLLNHIFILLTLFILFAILMPDGNGMPIKKPIGEIIRRDINALAISPYPRNMWKM